LLTAHNLIIHEKSPTRELENRWANIKLKNFFVRFSLTFSAHKAAAWQMSSLSIVVHLLISICSRSTYVMYFLLLFPIKTDIHKAVPSCCCYPTAWIVCYVHILNHKWTSVWVYGYLETRQLFGCSSIVLSLHWHRLLCYCCCRSVLWKYISGRCHFLDSSLLRLCT
jgi:hypothetical protein